jgi:hypothetical protein
MTNYLSAYLSPEGIHKLKLEEDSLWLVSVLVLMFQIKHMLRSLANVKTF